MESPKLILWITYVPYGAKLRKKCDLISKFSTLHNDMGKSNVEQFNHVSEDSIVIYQSFK